MADDEAAGYEQLSRIPPPGSLADSPVNTRLVVTDEMTGPEVFGHVADWLGGRLPGRKMTLVRVHDDDHQGDDGPCETCGFTPGVD